MTISLANTTKYSQMNFKFNNDQTDAVSINNNLIQISAYIFTSISIDDSIEGEQDETANKETLKMTVIKQKLEKHKTNSTNHLISSKDVDIFIK